MRKGVFFLFLLLSSGLATAQNYLEGGMKEVLNNDVRLSGCNYASYFTVYNYLDAAGKTALTPAPDGYEPFYITTYMRHGSRWLAEASQYDSPINVLKKAEANGALTEKGRVLLGELKRLRELCPNSKFGVLTDIGAAQHRDIARRMCRNFPEIFNAQGSFFAQSSVVKRCVLSMNAEAEIIDSVVGKHITQAKGRKGMQDRLAGIYTTTTMDNWRNKGYSYHSKERDTMTPYTRLCGELFTNISWSTPKSLRSFSRMLFDLAESIQNHGFDIDLYKYYTNDEIEALWTIKNNHWYRMFGPSPTTGGLSPLRAKWQMEDFLEGADSIANRKDWHGCNLRFGHDTSLMPLACLMELGTCGEKYTEAQLTTLDKTWRNQEMFPMGGNIQIVFYRPVSGNGDILVKALLNEVEVTLPGKAVAGPYYRWTEIRNHWKASIDR